MDELEQFKQEMKVTRRPYGDTMYLYVGNREIAQAEIEEGMSETELTDIENRILEGCWDFANWRAQKHQ